MPIIRNIKININNRAINDSEIIEYIGDLLVRICKNKNINLDDIIYVYIEKDVYTS
jgi:hypothetical protein